MPYTQLARYDNWEKAYADFVNQDGTSPGATTSEETGSGRVTPALRLRGRQDSGKTATPRNVGSPTRSEQHVELNPQGDNNSSPSAPEGRQLRKRNLSLLARQ